MPIAASGTTEFDTAIPEFWLNEAIIAFQENSVLAANGLVEIDPGNGKYSSKGDTVHKQVVSDDIEVQDKDEYEEYESDVPETTARTLTIDQQPYVSWKDTELKNLMALDLTTQIVRDGVAKMVARFENDVLAEYTNATHAVGTPGTPVNRSAILAARRKFRVANVPTNKPWALLIGAEDEEALLDTDDFVHVDKAGTSDALRNGMLGRMFGFNVYQTNRIPTASGVNYNLALHPDAITVAVRPLPLVPGGGDGRASMVLTDPGSGLSFRWHRYYKDDEGTWVSRIEMLYGVKTFRPEALCQVRS